MLKFVMYLGLLARSPDTPPAISGTSVAGSSSANTDCMAFLHYYALVPETAPQHNALSSTCSRLSYPSSLKKHD